MQKTLGALSADLETEIKTIASADEVDLARLQELDVKLAARFDPRSGYETCFATGLATAAVNTTLRCVQPAHDRLRLMHFRSPFRSIAKEARFVVLIVFRVRLQLQGCGQLQCCLLSLRSTGWPFHEHCNASEHRTRLCSSREQVNAHHRSCQTQFNMLIRRANFRLQHFPMGIKE